MRKWWRRGKKGKTSASPEAGSFSHVNPALPGIELQARGSSQSTSEGGPGSTPRSSSSGETKERPRGPSEASVQVNPIHQAMAEPGRPSRSSRRKRTRSRVTGSFSGVGDDGSPVVEDMDLVAVLVRDVDDEDERQFQAWMREHCFDTGLLVEGDVATRDLRALYLSDTKRSTWLSFMRGHWLRPLSLFYTLGRVGDAMTTSRRAVSYEEHPRSYSCNPLAWPWTHGISRPILTNGGYKRQVISDNTVKGILSGVKTTLHGIFMMSLGIRIWSAIQSGFSDTVTTLEDGDKETWKRFIYQVMGDADAAFWFAVLAPTTVIALFKIVVPTVRSLSTGRGKLVSMAGALQQALQHPSIWRSWIRPMLPLDPSKFKMAELAAHLRSDGRPGFIPRYRVVVTNYLIQACQLTKGWHRLDALRHLSELSVGTHVDDIPAPPRALSDSISPRGSQDGESKASHVGAVRKESAALGPLSHARIRIETAKLLRKFAEERPEDVVGHLYVLWARYHAWMAGQKTSKKLVAVFTVLEILRELYYYYGARTIFEAIQAYLACPKQTGVSMARIAPSAHQFTQGCFNAYLLNFRKVPGQPIADLIRIIHGVHFTQRVIPLDLSYKQLNAGEVAQILNALRSKGVSVQELNLEGNNLATASDWHLLMPVLAQMPGLQSLDLTNVQLENGNSAGADQRGTMAMAEVLPQLGSLRTLIIKTNGIGLASSNGTQAIAKALPHCSYLETFVMVDNALGRSDDEGLAAIAYALPNIPSLRTLELDDFVFSASLLNVFGHSFSSMNKLEKMTLRRTFVHGVPQEAVANMTFGLSGMAALQSLNFTGTTLGVPGPAGTIALANATRALKQLEEVDLSDTFFGYAGPEDGAALVDAMRARPNPLRKADFKINRFTREHETALNGILLEWGLEPMPTQLRNAGDVHRFLADRPSEESCVTLVDGPQNDEAMDALFKQVAGSDVQCLIIDGLRYRPTEEAFRHVGNCTQLTRLEFTVSVYDITIWPSTLAWQIFFENLSQIKGLQVLGLRGARVLQHEGPTNAPHLAEALKGLPELREVDLYAAGLALEEDTTRLVINALRGLKKLKKLLLRMNFFGFEGQGASTALFDELPHFSSLEYLDVSSSLVGTYANSTSRIAEFLRTVGRPFYFNATISALGKHPEEAQALLEALADNGHVSADMRGSGYSLQAWPDKNAQFAARMYDGSLRAACSYLQCFGVETPQPPINPNVTRVSFRASGHRFSDDVHGAMSGTAILMSAAVGVFALFAGVVFIVSLLGVGGRRTRQVVQVDRDARPAGATPGALLPRAAQPTVPSANPEPEKTPPDPTEDDLALTV